MGSRTIFFLEQPTDADLRSCFAILSSDPGQFSVPQHTSAVQRTPCLHDNIIGLAVRRAFDLAEARMIPYLIHHGLDVTVLCQCPHMMGEKVADTDGSDPALPVQLLKSPLCGAVDFPPVIVPTGHGRPVDQVEVQVFQSQLFHGFIKCPQRFVISPVAVPDLCADE